MFDPGCRLATHTSCEGNRISDFDTALRRKHGHLRAVWAPSIMGDAVGLTELFGMPVDPEIRTAPRYGCNVVLGLVEVSRFGR